MNLRSIKSFLALLLTMTVLIACSKDEPEEVANDTTASTTTISVSDDTVEDTDNDGDDTNNDDGDNTPSYKFSGKVDGEDWNTDTVGGIFIVDEYAGMARVIASNSNGSSVAVTISSPKDSTYALNKESVGYVTYTNAGDTTFTTAVGDNSGGLLTISSFTDGTITGEFDMELYNEDADSSFQLTEAVFTDVILTEVENSFGAKIAGTSMDATIYTGLVSGTNLIIGGAEGTGYPNVALQMPLDIEAGTYDFDITTYAAIYASAEGDANLEIAFSGALTITSHDKAAKHIVGTFNFGTLNTNTFASTEITEGTFDIYYF